MRRWLLVVTLLAATPLGSGCTHNFLQQSTLSSSGTVTAFQTQQVLNNLAMISCNPAANPCHLNISSGVVQVTDQATGTLLGNLFQSGPGGLNGFTPSLSAQRGLVEQWTVAPVTDGEQLETLRVAYNKVLHPTDPDADDNLINQILSLCIRFTLLPKEDTIRTILRQDAKDPKPHEAASELCHALERELGTVDTKIGEMSQTITELRGIAQPKSAYDVRLKIDELVSRRDLLQQQHMLLEELMNSNGRANGTRLTRAAVLDPLRSQQGVTPSDASDSTLLVLTALQAKDGAGPGYLPTTDLMWPSTRNPALVDQAEDQIGRLDSLLWDKKFKSPWICCGTKVNVPPCACYVGHYKGCNGEAYVWVMPENYATLREFTQIIQTLGAPTSPSEHPASSPAYSPNLR